MKSTSIIFFITILIASSLYSQTNTSEDNKNKLTYGEKGIIELYGGLNFSGNSDDFSSCKFSAGPGFNYFIARNFYMGSGLLVRVNRGLVKTRIFYYYIQSSYKTNVDLGLAIPFGFIFKINDRAYFNLVAPEFQFYWYNLNSFRVYPNVITSFKFPVDNAIIDVGVRHNFFNFSEKKASNIYYSYNVFLGFSVCFDTIKKNGSAKINILNDNTPPDKKVINTIDNSTRNGKIAGAFFLSWLPVSSGSWLAGWDWGGLVFSVLKTTAVCSLVAFISRPSKVPEWAFGFGLFALPIATITDMIYSPCRVAYRLDNNLKKPDNPDSETKKHVGTHSNKEPEVFFNALPRLSLKRDKSNKNVESPSYNKIDGLNVMITHTL